MHEVYENPLTTRYASRAMQEIFSQDTRTKTWRKLWVALAESEMELGLPVTQAQVDELRAHIDDIDYEAEARKEREIRHDVMAHVYAYGLVCPNAKGIIHLGATSCYVTDNADVLIYRDALRLVRSKVVEVLRRLRSFALEYKSMPTLGLTHLQPAQLVTVGKRACLWMQDLLMDLEDIDHTLDTTRLLGNKGTTGTQASFLDLMDGDGAKVVDLEKRIAHKMGMDKVFAVSGQTYPRKLDFRIMSALSAVAQSAYKFAQDLRLLQSYREIEEPFEKNQVGSSAMAYKRNPMRSERMCSLSRHVMALNQDAAMTASTQWFERTLDDSANRRIAVSEAFLGVDAILNIMMNVCDGLVVYEKVIRARVMNELPFMASENIMMDAVKRGGDRQQLHEKLRVHSQAAARVVKEEGGKNDLIDRIASDPAFMVTREEIEAILDPANFTGRSEEQVEEFLRDVIRPVLEAFDASVTWNSKDRLVVVTTGSSLVRVYFLDVGQGDATLIDCGETEVLIDGGTNSTGKDVVAAIAPYIDGKLDYVIATHPDADHVGGLDAVLAAFEVGEVIDSGRTADTETYKDYWAAVKAEGVFLRACDEAGRRLALRQPFVKPPPCPSSRPATTGPAATIAASWPSSPAATCRSSSPAT